MIVLNTGEDITNYYYDITKEGFKMGGSMVDAEIMMSVLEEVELYYACAGMLRAINEQKIINLINESNE